MESIENTLPERAPQEPKKTGRTIAIALVVVVALVAIATAGYGLAVHPAFTAVLRDILIIVLALVTILIGLFLVILIFQLQSLIALLRHEIKPILESANQTVSTVRGTTSFVSTTLVTPAITVASYVSAVRQTLKALVGSQGRREQRRDTRQEPGQE